MDEYESMKWRIVSLKIAGLKEIETYWTYTDILECILTLDYQNACEYISIPEQWQPLEN